MVGSAMVHLGRWTWTSRDLHGAKRDVYETLSLNTQKGYMPRTGGLLGVWTAATLCRKLPGDQSFGLGEEAATLAIGSDAGCGVCGGVEAERLAAIDVLAGGEDEVATLGIFVEPQLPMTHPRGGE